MKALLAWLRSGGSPRFVAPAEPEAPPPEPRLQPVTLAAMPVAYLPLHRYLVGRFADRVVLTIDEIEDLLGIALPEPARRDPGWWSNVAAGPAASWTQASRTAILNLGARKVTFDRVAG